MIDDAQWLDRASAQALPFVARRLLAEGVVMLFAAREPGKEFAGLPELVVEGLGEADARELLRASVPGQLDDRMARQLVEETRGNPLALLELPRGLSPARLAAGFGLLGAASLSGRIEESYLKRLDALPEDTRRILVVAAAEPTGDPTVLWRAGERLGITAAALEPAESAGLLEVGARVRFCHPLVRSAVYGAASLRERRSMHQALAGATDARTDPDRRAWHRAEASAGPDEDVAAELERAAARAQARGGLAAAAAFLQRSVELTPEPSRRAQRGLAAAQASLQAGAFDEALGMLDLAQTGAVDEFQRARVDLVRAQLAFAVNRGSDAPPLLLKAAKQLASLDPRLARETYLEAVRASLYAGRFCEGGVRKAGSAARSAPAPPAPVRPLDLLLDGFALAISGGYAAGVPTLQQALAAFADPAVAPEELVRFGDSAAFAASALWDARWGPISERVLALCRETGAGEGLPRALSLVAGWRLQCGELGAASTLLNQLDDLARATGLRLPMFGAVALATGRGDEAAAQPLLDDARKDATTRGEGLALTLIDWMAAVLYNGLGKHEEALAVGMAAYEHPEELRNAFGIHELIEAAVRTGHDALAARVLAVASEMAAAVGTDEALGHAARSRALLSRGEAAEALYREAIERLERTPFRIMLARAHLAYGEWLRRESRRLDAREHLRTAHDTLTAAGVDAFAERAERELLATGEHVRKRSVEAQEELSAQEAQVARLARAGLSNREIAARLFISPHTVHYHLRKVFAKLNITSRNQLGLVLSDSAGG
ncbi:MAG TPA: LuxR C-terminal-related transcriptional regulator, partial [Solirubrobacteraceae bacterium]|nr:LuxR C-terminal-related transcriptional regulator [Solirubrobacteraceae bacterium]